MRSVICHRLSIWFRSMICIAFRSTEPGGFALLAGDASVNSWFREICSTSLACLFSDWIPFSRKKKTVFVLGRSEFEFVFSLLPCHFTMKER